MQAIFLVSLVVQVALAAHAYNRGRTSPWVWIILFFPFVGSALYVFLFILPQLTRSARPNRARRGPAMRRVPRGPFAPAGNRPDNAIPVVSVAEIETQVRREECPECGSDLFVDDHRAETIAGRDLRVIVSLCRRCGAAPVWYFEVQGDDGGSDGDDEPMPSRVKH